VRGKAGMFTSRTFLPSQYSGLTGWWDASDNATLFDATTGGSPVAADGLVARLEDKSGNARHFTMSTSGFRPLRKTAVANNLDVIRFDGSNDYLENSARFRDVMTSTDGTVFVVASATAISTDSADAYSNETVLGTTGASSHGFVAFRSSGTAYSWGYYAPDDAYRTASRSYTQGTWALFTTVHGSSSLRFKINGGEEATATLDFRSSWLSGPTMAIGLNDSLFYFEGDVGEIAIYDVALSNSAIADIELYFTKKWGL